MVILLFWDHLALTTLVIQYQFVAKTRFGLHLLPSSHGGVKGEKMAVISKAVEQPLFSGSVRVIYTQDNLT